MTWGFLAAVALEDETGLAALNLLIFTFQTMAEMTEELWQQT
jgi:hypothetical protein